jgi:dienelactone hydrolase
MTKSHLLHADLQSGADASACKKQQICNLHTFTLLLLSMLLSLLSYSTVFAQENPQWDDTQKKNWSEIFQLIEIPSSLDDSLQKAYFYKTTSPTPQPLIISLHTWSGDYTQQDPLAEQVAAKNWNYIHPDFRGPNNTFKACGSPWVISDIEDAITFAIQEGHVDTTEIHIIGVSGGGFATTLMYMKTQHPVKSFSAWVPITNLVDWYYESLGRGNQYADHIWQATRSDSTLNLSEAKKRSSYFMDTPVRQRSKSKLTLYAGIHDGYTGSVPITQSINFYNKLVKETDPSEVSAIVPTETILQLVTKRNYPGNSSGEILGDRPVIFQKHFRNIHLILFEGGHEMLSDIALEAL